MKARRQSCQAQSQESASLLAAALAGEGVKVVVHGRTEARVNAALRQIRQSVEHADVHGVAADLGTSAGVRVLVKQVPETDIHQRRCRARRRSRGAQHFLEMLLS